MGAKYQLDELEQANDVDGDRAAALYDQARENLAASLADVLLKLAAMKEPGKRVCRPPC